MLPITQLINCSALCAFGTHQYHTSWIGANCTEVPAQSSQQSINMAVAS